MIWDVIIWIVKLFFSPVLVPYELFRIYLKLVCFLYGYMVSRISSVATIVMGGCLSSQKKRKEDRNKNKETPKSETSIELHRSCDINHRENKVLQRQQQQSALSLRRRFQKDNPSNFQQQANQIQDYSFKAGYRPTLFSNSVSLDFHTKKYREPVPTHSNNDLSILEEFSGIRSKPIEHALRTNISQQFPPLEPYASELDHSNVLLHGTSINEKLQYEAKEVTDTTVENEQCPEFCHEQPTNVDNNRSHDSAQPNVENKMLVTSKSEIQNYKHVYSPSFENRTAFKTRTVTSDISKINLCSENNELSQKGEELNSTSQTLKRSDTDAQDNDLAGSPKKARYEKDYFDVEDHYTIISKLQGKLQEKYVQDIKLEKDNVFHFDVRTRQVNGIVLRESCTLSNLLSLKSKNILVFGKPGFGKSVLCQTLAFQWADLLKGMDMNPHSAQPTIQKFNICVYYKLKNNSILNLEERLINKHYDLVKTASITENLFRTAWEYHMESTIIILDGYDRLTEERKQQFKQFLKINLFFEKASIVLTSNPPSDMELSVIFLRQADIDGLSEQTLNTLPASKISRNDWKSKVLPLYGVSPLLSCLVLKALAENQSIKSLFDLVEIVLGYLIERKYGKNVRMVDLDSYLNRVGELLLHKLIRGMYYVKKEELEVCLTDKMKYITDLEIFHIVRHSELDADCFVLAHYIFVQYFSVKFLRYKWSRMKFESQRELLFKEIFRFQGCSEYVLVDKVIQEEGHVYVVGITPEIVLQLSSNSLLSGDFHMRQDTNCSEIQEAFQVVNLLLRMHEKILPRYRINRLKDDDIENTFADIICMLDFSNLNVAISYFQETGSPYVFMKIAAVNEEEKIAALSIVVSRNHLAYKSDRDCFDIGNELYLDIRCSELNDTYPFLMSIFSKCYSTLTLKAKWESVEDMMYDLVLSSLEYSKHRYTKLSLMSDYFVNPNIVTWEVISEANSAPIASFSYTSPSGHTQVRKFNPIQVAKLKDIKNRDQPITIMKSILDKVKNPCLTVHMKSKFHKKAELLM